MDWSYKPKTNTYFNNYQTFIKSISSSLNQLQKRYLNIVLPSTLEIDHPELYELNNLLLHPLPSTTVTPTTTTTTLLSSSSSSSTTTTTRLKQNRKNHYVVKKRNYKKKLITLYESIRQQPDLWHQLTIEQLNRLYHIIKPNSSHPSFAILNVNALHILQDIQYHTPQQFTPLHAEWLLTCYKENGELSPALEFMENQSLILNPTPKMYRLMIGLLTTSSRSQDQQQLPVSNKMMKLSFAYFQKFKESQQQQLFTNKMDEIQEENDLILGYLLSSYVSRNYTNRAAELISTHYPHWLTSSSHLLNNNNNNNNDIPNQFQLISTGLEKILLLLGKYGKNKNEFNYTDSRQLYRVQCQFYKRYKTNDNMDYGLKKQPMAGLLQLVQQCVRMDRLDWVHELLNDAMYYGHQHGKKVIGRYLLQSYIAKDNLRHALDLHFNLTNNDMNSSDEIIFPIEQSKSLLIKSAKAKYHMDIYKLYHYMMKTSPLSLDLRLYTRVLQSFIRTKHYQYAQQVVNDALHQSHIYESTASTLHTNRFFNIIYSLCAQTGDLELFQRVVSVQRAVGLHDLHHHSLTSLMSTYIKINQIPSAKAVFDHLDQSTLNNNNNVNNINNNSNNNNNSHVNTNVYHYHQNNSQDSYQSQQQQQQQSQQHFISNEEKINKPGVDVVDYNLLLLTAAKEENGNGPMANNVLEILRQMSDRGISPNKTTLRTLLALYKKNEGPMEEEIFHQLLMDTKATKEDQIWLNNMKLTKLIHNSNDNNNNNNDVRKENEKNVFLATKLFLSNQRENLFSIIPSPSSSLSSQPILANSMTYKILLDQLTKYPRHARLADTVYLQMRSKGWRPPMEIYERLMILWLKKGRYQKMKSIMDDYCQDMGLQHPPTRMYTLLLDRLVILKNRNLIQYWVKTVKENNIPIDSVLEKRLKKYGLYDHFSFSNLNTSSTSL
ncbi:unnamed protein product [Cunninghamella blakesleeana]